MSDIRTRIAKPHVVNCFSVEQPFDKWHKWAWSTYVGESRFLNKRGWGHGYTLWLVFPCNDPKCTAELLVCSADVITAGGVFK